MTKIESTNVLKEFIETYIKSHGEEDVITVQLDNVDIEAFSTIVKELEKETVSRESYDHEYFLRKELSLKVYKLDRLLEQADLALSKIKTKLRSSRGVCDYLIVDEIEKITNEYDEIVMKIFDFVERKRGKLDENM